MIELITYLTGIATGSLIAIWLEERCKCKAD